MMISACLMQEGKLVHDLGQLKPDGERELSNALRRPVLEYTGFQAWMIQPDFERAMLILISRPYTRLEALEYVIGLMRAFSMHPSATVCIFDS